MMKVIFLIVGIGSSFCPVVEQQFKKIIAPIYGEQREALQKIFRENSDRVCELMFAETDKQRQNPLGLILYKNQLSNEYSRYGINKGLEVKTLCLIDAEKNSGKGLGTKLIFRVLSKCIEKNAENLFLTASSKASFSPAEFFKKFHFVEKHHWTGKFEDNEATEYLLNRDVHLHQITLQEKYLKKIIEGIKTREGRTNTGMFTRINNGQLIRFFNPTTKSQVYTEIVSADKHNSFHEMLDGGKLKDYLPEMNNLDKAVEVYHKIPGYQEKADKHGVLGFKLRKIEVEGEKDKMKWDKKDTNKFQQPSTAEASSSSTRTRNRTWTGKHIRFDEEEKRETKKLKH